MSSEVINDSQVQELLKRLSDLPKTLEKALKLIGNDQLTSVMDTFEKNGQNLPATVTGEVIRWDGLHQRTRFERKKMGKWGDVFNPYDGKILRRTGSYLKSWNYELIQDGVSIGTADSRAKLLNDGGINDEGIMSLRVSWTMFFKRTLQSILIL